MSLLRSNASERFVEGVQRGNYRTDKVDRIRSLQRISAYGHITGKIARGGFIIGEVNGCYTLLTLVRFYLVLYLADFPGDIMFRDRDLVRERDLGHAEGFYFALLRVRPPGRRADRPQGGQLG